MPASSMDNGREAATSPETTLLSRSPEDVTTGLEGRWPFNDGTNPTTDASGNGHDGTLMGDPVFTTTVPITIGSGTALDFDGSGDYVTVGGDEADFDLNIISIALWLKVDSFTTVYQAIVTKGDNAWRIHRNASTNFIQFATTSGGSHQTLNSTVDMVDGKWHHVVAVYDGAQKLLYIDGVLDNFVNYTNVIDTNDYPVLIGENGQVTGRYFDGQMDDVRIYSRALSADDVAQLYANQSDHCYVETTGDNVTDYLSPDASALQTAVSAASPGDTIKVAGTCAGVQTFGTFTQTVYITQALTLQGGYTTTNWLASPDPVAHPTVLDAEGNGRVVNIATTSNITLDSLTLTGGDGTVGGGNTYGGAIRLPGGATLNLSNDYIHNNYAERGGVLNTSNGIVNVTNSLLMSNTANYRGGTLYGESASVFNLTNSQVLSNTADQGGGFHSSHSTNITLVNSVVAYNTGSSLAGAVLNFGDTLTLINSTIHHNTTSGTAGAIYNTSGGIIYAYNSTISNNSAGSYGAIYQSSSAFTTTLFQSTIADNIATNGIGGIHLNGGAFTTSNTIMANSGNNCSLSAGTISSGGYNLIIDTTCPLNATGDITNTNPLLMPLADNGGDTETHGLFGSSPAIDHIPVGVNGCGTTVTTDQRGVLRPQISGCDIGSFEYEPPITCFVETTGDNTTDYSSANADAVQAAVNVANPGDLLKVAGTCAGTHLQGGQTQTVYISQTLTVQGGYTNTNWLAAPDPAANSTVLDAEGNGRVVYIPAGHQVTLDGLTLTGGDTTAGGGGIYSNSVLTVTNSTIANNSADNGSGIRNDNTLTVANVTLTGNASTSNGTINNGGWASIQASTFYTNTAFRGGGVYASGGSTLWVANSTFAHNAANEGGGIHNRGVMTVTNSTFAYNAATFGGGLQTWNGTMYLYNNILANNMAAEACLTGGGLLASVNNLTDDGTCSPTITADPLLAPLGNNGGSTLTFMLQPGSLAIDAGDDPTCEAADQRGIARPEGPHCDIGAVEVGQEVLNVTVTGTGSGIVNSNPAGITCGITCTASFYANIAVTLTASADTGSTFTGWSGDCTGTGNCVVTMDTTHNVTAEFTLDQHDLTVALSGNGSGSVSSNPAGINCEPDCAETYDYGTVVTLTASTNTGSAFTGWSGDCSGTGDCVVTMDAAKNVTATFTLDQHDLTVALSGTGSGSVTSSPAGINCEPDCSETYDYGTVVTLTASTNTGSTFTGWSGDDCTGSGECVITMDAAKNVTATFTLGTNALSVTLAGTGSGTVTSDPAGIDCGVTCVAVFDYGTVVTLTAVTDPGSTFTGWSGACTGIGDCTVTMDAAQNVTATFTLEQYELSVTVDGTGGGTVTSSPAGIDCGADCVESYDFGTVVTLTAVADNNSTFTGWSGACTGMGVCVVTMDTAQSVTATFAQNEEPGFFIYLPMVIKP